MDYGVDKKDVLVFTQFVVIVVLSAVLLQGRGGHSKTYFEEEQQKNVSIQGQSKNLTFQVFEDRLTGYNILINASNFTFAPEDVNSYHEPGQGHAHVYIDDVKWDRVYSKYYYLYKVPQDIEKINVTVSLHANDHRMYYEDGSPVSVSKMVYLDR